MGLGVICVIIAVTHLGAKYIHFVIVDACADVKIVGHRQSGTPKPTLLFDIE